MNITLAIFIIGVFLIGFLLLMTELIILFGKKKRNDERIFMCKHNKDAN